MSYIFIPDVGELTREEYDAYRAAKEYDERLVFSWNPDGQDYVLYIKTDMSDGMPRLKKVLGFGRECPSPDKIKETLYESDGWKHGDKVLREMDAREKTRTKNSTMVREAIAEEAAVRIEHTLRRDGKSPIIKSLRK